MNAKAHEVVEIPPPDFRQAYPHIHAEQRRADAIQKGDYIIIPNGGSPLQQQQGPDPSAGRPVVGLTYEINTSTTSLKSEWVLMAFGAEMMTWRCKRDDLFWVRIPHDAATCEYCLFRLNVSLGTIKRMLEEGRNSIAAEYQVQLDLLRQREESPSAD